MLSLRLNTPCAAAAALWLTACAGCASPDKTETHPESLGDCESFYLCADSADLRRGVTVAVASDRALRVTNGNTVRLVNARQRQGELSYTSEQPIFDLLLRLEQTVPAQYRPQTTPFEAYLCPMSADALCDLLMTQERGGVLIPGETRRFSWPAVNDNGLWLMAATELCMASGDDQTYRRLRYVARNLAAIDTAVAWNRSESVFTGMPSYMAADPALPSWMTPTDMLQSSVLADNVARYAAAAAIRTLDDYHGYREEKFLPVSPDTLRRNINTLMWAPNLGHYAALLYGAPVCPVQMPSADNRAQALALLSGVASQPMAETAVRRTPVPETGIEPYTPRWNARNPLSSLTQALWTAACARAGNETAYRYAVGALLYRRCMELASAPDSAALTGRPITALILRGLLGASFSPEGMHLSPFVPESMPGEKVINNLRYRGATLRIRLSGTGNAISTFMVDSVACEPFIAGTLKGRHEVSITLGGASADRGEANITAGPTEMMPQTPAVSWLHERQAAIGATAEPADTLTATPAEEHQEESADYLVCLNGTVIQQIYRHDYTLYNAPEFTVVQFLPVSSGHAVGFSGTPYYYIPQKQRTLIYATSVAKGGTRLIQDKLASTRFVEINRYRNRTLSFTYEALTPGRYLVDVRYLDGMGIVNSKRRSALRTLSVNGRRAGTLVFQQLSSAWWNKDLGEQWQQLTSWSNAVEVRLNQGANTFDIRYIQPSPEYLDPLNNSVLIEAIRIIPLPADI